MAAFVDRWPWAASRGGSTTKRVKSIVFGRPPAAMTSWSNVATRRWKSAKIFMNLPLATKRAALSQVRRIVKDAPVLGERIAIGHPRDIVRHGPSAARFTRRRLGAFGGERPFRRHSRGIREEGVKKPTHDFVGLFANAHHLGVAIHAGREEVLYVDLGVGEAWRKPDQGAPRRAHILC